MQSYDQDVPAHNFIKRTDYIFIDDSIFFVFVNDLEYPTKLNIVFADNHPLLFI